MYNMAAENKITALKLEKIRSVIKLQLLAVRSGLLDYKDKNINESEDTNYDEQNSHKDDIKQYERVDAEEHCKRIRRIFRHT